MKDLKCLQKMLFLLMMGFSLSVVYACGDDGNDEPFTGNTGSNGTDNGGDIGSNTPTVEDNPSLNTTDIAVTGLMDSCGCTYAYVSGYANLHQLPASSGDLVIGVTINDGQYTQTANVLEGNHFSVTFKNLHPGVEYKYRSFVRYAGITHYATEYRTFTTLQAYNVATTGMATDVTYKEATVTSHIQLSSVDKREDIQLGVAYSVSGTALHPDSLFNELLFNTYDVENDEYAVMLTGLNDNTTYYYASFTSFNGVYVFSDVKTFTTEENPTGGILNGHEWVDLGLPSGLKWATCNVGATSPESYGGYYAWGETEEKSDYDLDTYKYYNNSTDEWLNISSNISGTQYDVAHVKWGGSWRMPTHDEIKELVNNCSWEYTTNGQLVTGSNGQSIFLPAAGFRNGTKFINRGSYGFYWFATSYSDYSGYAYHLCFDNDNSLWSDWNDRINGFSVRPVTDDLFSNSKK